MAKEFKFPPPGWNATFRHLHSSNGIQQEESYSYDDPLTGYHGYIMAMAKTMKSATIEPLSHGFSTDTIAN